jgi:DNA-binding NarL/FixJ family response regulator
VDTVLIVDDHDGYRSFLAQMLEGAEFSVVGTAEDGESAVPAVEELKPDLVLLDVQLPGIDGFEVAERLNRIDPPPAVILISTRDREDFGVRLTTAPVLGFVPKHEMSLEAVEELLHAAAS